MLTYQLREHTLMLENGNALVFPNEVEIEFTFCPSAALGMVTERGRTAFKGDIVRISFNANTGRQHVASSSFPRPLKLIIEDKTHKYYVNI